MSLFLSLLVLSSCPPVPVPSPVPGPVHSFMSVWSIQECLDLVMRRLGTCFLPITGRSLNRGSNSLRGKDWSKNPRDTVWYPVPDGVGLSG
jgi:hypothetical protein